MNKFARKCPNCGTEVRKFTKYCPDCRTKIDDKKSKRNTGTNW